MNRRCIATFLMAAVMAPALGAQGAAAATLAASAMHPSGDPPTWAKDVAPIMQAKCQVCHQPNSVAPMSLLTYADAKKAARKIESRVSLRRMPPWHLDKTVGIQAYKNDRSLTDEQIHTIVRWVEAGAPQGNPADEPPPVKWPDPTEWQFAERFGAPDLVMKSPPFTRNARGEDKWFRPLTETGLTEERWVKAIEIKPSFPDGRRVVHHVLTMLEQDEMGVTGLASSAQEMGPMSAGLFMEWALGKTGEIYNDDAGKLMLPGAKIRWELHYYAIGKDVKDDQVELGVWFYPKGYKPKHRTILNMFNAAPNSQLDIPPGAKTVTQNFYVLRAPARIENFQPHMHMRGKAMTMEAVFPDGKREVLASVSDFQWKWHNNYIFADSVAPLLPSGTTLVFTAWHDNSKDNPNNPDPEQWIGWGDRTVDEMAHAWVDVTYLDQADFDQLVAARKPQKRQP